MTRSPYHQQHARDCDPSRLPGDAGTVPQKEIQVGYNGIRLFEADEIAAEQVGYAFTAQGTWLCTGKAGDWDASWLVIGHDTCINDPIMIDTAAPGLPVLTAAHGEGSWNAEPIAASCRAFLDCLPAFAALGQGRENPVKMEANPLPQGEVERFVQQSSERCAADGAQDFWNERLEQN